MFGKNDVSDRELSKTVNSRLARTGTGSHIIATITRGVVTLRGNLQYTGQRMPVMKAAQQVAGVRQVIDQMQVAQKKPNPPPYKAPPAVQGPPQATPAVEVATPQTPAPLEVATPAQAAAPQAAPVGPAVTPPAVGAPTGAM